MPGFELYLIRHGIAAERGADHPDDGKRPLTAKGVARLKDEVDGLVTLGVTLDQVFTSGLVRAKQTAEFVAAGLPESPPVSVLAALAPGHAPADVLAALAKHAEPGRVALVGHEPDIGALAAFLIGARRPLVFKKGAICRIDVNSLPPTRGGTLVWFLTPRVLRTLGR